MYGFEDIKQNRLVCNGCPNLHLETLYNIFNAITKVYSLALNIGLDLFCQIIMHKTKDTKQNRFIS